MKLLTLYLYTCFTILLGTLGLFGFWSFYPYHVSDFQQPIVILNKDHVIKAGDPIRWEVKVKIFGKWHYDSKQEIIGRDKNCDYKILRTNSGVTEIMNYDRINASNIIPAYFKPCAYYVLITTTFQLNPIRTFTIQKNTEDFKVIN